VFYRVASSLGAPIQLNTPTVENESSPPDLPNNNSNRHLLTFEKLCMLMI